MTNPKGIKVQPDALKDGPILLQKTNGYSIYYLVVGKTGLPSVRRELLGTKILETAQIKFEAWKKKHAGNGARKPTANLPAVINGDDEARRAKAAEKYAAKKAGKIEVDREVIEAVMQSLSSSLQSVAAGVRILDTVLRAQK